MSKRKTEVEIHPAAAIFPPATETELQALADDIKAHGLRQPIVRHTDGRILDGRNRYQACKIAGVEPTFEIWNARGSELDYVVSQNLHRRHMTASQKALVAAKMANYAHGGDRSKASNDALKVSRHQAAKALGLSESSVDRAAKLLAANNAELVKAVETNTASVNAAISLAGLPREKLKEALKSADPKALREALSRHKKARIEIDGPKKADGILRWSFEQAAGRLRNTAQLVVLDVADPETCRNRLEEAAQLVPPTLHPDAVIACLAEPKELPYVIGCLSAVVDYRTVCACLVGDRGKPAEWLPVVVFSAGEPSAPSIIHAVDRAHAADAVAHALRSKGSVVWLPQWEPVNEQPPSDNSIEREAGDTEASGSDMPVVEM